MAAPKELLKRVPLFQGLDDKHIDTLSRTFTDRTFNAGQEITSEGGGGVGFFIIEDGEAVVSVGGEERRTLGSGDYFGEIALIDEGARTASVTADTDMTCYAMTLWEFRPIVETDSRIAWKLVQALAHKLREADARSDAS
jgi:CRP/FNR family transcriptional regulator, cyclic AMP receptor protein